MPQRNEDVADQLRALREEYASRLPGRIEELAGLLDEARSAPDRVERAILEAHRLRGNAGVYGWAAVGKAAGRIEDSLRRLGSSSGFLPDELWAEVRGAVAEMREAVSASPASVPEPAPEVLSGSILVVDDDPDFHEIAAEVGRGQMVEVISASNYAEALERARQREIRAAILDVGLEEGDSFQLATMLRTLPGYESLPIAFASADHELLNRVAAAHVGGMLFLAKPVDPPALGEAIGELLRARDARQARVLIVEDDLEFARHTTFLLAHQGIRSITSEDPSNILEVLEEFDPDLVLLDMVMPKFSGLEVCRTIRTSPRWREMPVVFVTARSDPETRLAAFEAGGDDYITKPVIPQELAARIQVRLERARLLRERHDRDPLSGLLTRRAFLEAAERLRSFAVRHRRPLSICLIDIDRFKQVNDTHGHLSGDQVISGFGRLLRGRFRREDLRGRWGGEEFVLAFLDEEPASVVAIVEKVLAELRETEFRSDTDEPFGVTFSAGVAGLPADGELLQPLIHAADQRLYQAKEEGRARVVGPAAPAG